MQWSKNGLSCNQDFGVSDWQWPSLGWGIGGLAKMECRMWYGSEDAEKLRDKAAEWITYNMLTNTNDMGNVADRTWSKC